jgi:hypothetical protein
LNVALPLLLIAVVTKTRSPHTTGLECASPGIGVRQTTFSPVLTSHVFGRLWPSATPDALGPRKDGQLSVAGFAADSFGARAGPLRTILRSPVGTVSPGGRHVLSRRTICRGTQASATVVRITRAPSTRYLYRPDVVQGTRGGPPVVSTTSSSLSTFHVPVIGGHSLPTIESVPSLPNVMVKKPYWRGVEGSGAGC